MVQLFLTDLLIVSAASAVFLLEIDTQNQTGKMDTVKTAIFQWFL